ncbi:transposase family protein [Streptomyces sp. Ru72]|uniref:transposase family protein n=1 Tax=Streptomyces sp. Ru72 TaxID=2080747 RepID=UPI0015E33B53|nr:transposase family protein [Streptomyces sp. Ru72]
MPSSLISMLARQRARMPGGLLGDATALVSLAEVLDAIPDPRSCRGRRYRDGPLLVLCLVAVLAGAVGWAGSTRFAAGLDPATRAQIGLVRGIPRATTVARLLRRLDGDVGDLGDALCGDAVGAVRGHHPAGTAVQLRAGVQDLRGAGSTTTARDPVCSSTVSGSRGMCGGSQAARKSYVAEPVASST